MLFPISILAGLLAIASIPASNAPKDDYRNLAKFHPAYHSSALNYDQTAQLVCDGIVDTAQPVTYTVDLDGRPLLKQDLAWLFDYRTFTQFTVEKADFDLTVNFNGFSVTADKLTFISGPKYIKGGDGKCDFSIQVSPDGKRWQTVFSSDRLSDLGKFDEKWKLHTEVALPERMSVAAIRVVNTKGSVSKWEISSIELYDGAERKDIYNMIPFRSSWVAEGTEPGEWVYVDLGDKLQFDSVRLHWTNPPKYGSILVSDDAVKWRRLASFNNEDEIRTKGKGRYVKVLCGPAQDDKRVALSEMEVLGWSRKGRVASDWWLVRTDQKDDPDAWVPVTLPSTVLAAYIDAGIVQDPAWADNNQFISDSYFKSDFIYKGTMEAPAYLSGHTFLNFDGINWKADVRMNGKSLGSIKGAFKRSSFDVTEIIRPGANEIEVLIHKNDNPSCGKGNTLQRNAYNGGILGADNPTFHASIGWDWIPSVHGRNIGIWNDVYFSHSGEVQISDPYVSTALNLPDTTRAEVTVEATLRNLSDSPSDAQWEFSIGEFGLKGSERLEAGESRKVSRKIIIDNPRLWWPNGYGEQNLYPVHMEVLTGGVLSDAKDFKTGLRQNTYSTSSGFLTVWVNGRRFSGRGGNWGFSEFNLRYREKEYDTAVRLHKEQNFTMIRNWVGQTMDDEFYEACDRYGIMVWQDFWLANPLDGPDPYDEDMFMDNLDDLLFRIRNHPSIVLYVGRNEGVPPASLDAKFRNSITAIHPDIFYAPDSSHGILGGNGNYRRMSTLDFFKIWDTKPALWGQDRVHSEKGCPNVPNYESFVKFMPPEHYWPQDDMWGVHDWSLHSAQTVGTFNDAVESMFGKADNARQFCEWAQWVNYDAFRAIFESRSEGRRGLQLWMSHPAWPTFVWCTYDYWFDPTAAFFGSKKACEPLHVMWNPLKKVVEVVNISGNNRHSLTVRARVLDMYGKELHRFEDILDSKEDSTVPVMTLPEPDEDVYYYSLQLLENGSVVSENFYVQGRETDNFKALHSLKKAKTDVICTSSMKEGEWTVACRIVNKGKVPAMMIRLMATDGKKGERILPVTYSDNYFHLMPGESKTIKIMFSSEDCPSANPYIHVSGFNNKHRSSSCRKNAHPSR